MRGMIKATCAGLLWATLLLLPAQAISSTFKGDVSNITGGNAYNGSWTFEVSIIKEPEPGKLKFTVVSTDTGINDFNGDMFLIPITMVKDGKYTFDGGDDTGDPNTAGLNLTGMFTPSKKDLMITSIVSGGLTFTVENIMPVPVPVPAPLGLLLLGFAAFAALAGQQHKRRSTA